ncbi:CDP-alcohol phosphatidyltransferase family protein [Rubrivirga litoralis]|uniref:CDP-alcohol phosphatidyltransferase family protein n=1 Tax=Rubrivirga litoralis TaxID=3075598 RepID=A0ABU3BSL2_9BACT|nr:CDP-alcohol phosphatidyltransferase family protein [Rubrivirga sp. F394]MDT0632268.1 CDP-alcohol phosphatidyltransferase family protein [Rubrivirga sp. F394]
MPTPPAPPAPPRPVTVGRFPEMGTFWTAANVLSLSRAVLVVPIAKLVYDGGPIGWMFALIGLAIATDWFDGRVARWSGTVSEWGKVLDATADKLAAAAVTVALLVRPPEAGPSLPLWFVVLAVSRDVLLAAGGLVQTRRLGRFTSSLWSGKVAVAALAATVVAALLAARPPVLDALVGLTAAAMAVSIVKYGLRFVAIVRHGPAALHADGNTLCPEHRVGGRGGGGR